MRDRIKVNPAALLLDGLIEAIRHKDRLADELDALANLKPMTAPDEPAGDDYSAEARANWLYLKGKADGWNECARHVAETITGEKS